MQNDKWPLVIGDVALDMAESSLKEEGTSKKNESLEDLKSHTFTDEEYQAERDHFLKVTNAFLYYR